MISTVHEDVIEAHILKRLDGPTLASAACASSGLHALAFREHLWARICGSMWSSSNDPLVRCIVSSFPNGHASFFSDVYPVVAEAASHPGRPLPGRLISAVDLFYRGKPIFSKVVETETTTEWFRCSPFRIDLVGPKDAALVMVPTPESNNTCRSLEDDLTLSWIVIDPIGKRAADISSRRPVSVTRHWLSGEIHARFAFVVTGEKQLGIVVTCGGGKGEGGMHVREVSLQVEDMDGACLDGRSSLEILRRTMEGKRGKGGVKREEETKRKYEEFLEKKRRRKERMMKREGILDMVCVVSGVLLFCLVVYMADTNIRNFFFGRGRS